MRVAVIGAGIIGLACAYHLQRSRAHVIVVDPAPEGDKASIGNAGALAVTEVVPASSPGVWWRAFGWMCDPLGPLSIRPAHATALLPWLTRFARSGNRANVLRISMALAALNKRAHEDWVPLLEDLGLAGHLHRTGALAVYESDAGFQRDAAEWRMKRDRGIEAIEMTGAQARSLEPALGARACRAVYAPQWSHVSDPRKILEALRTALRGRGVEFKHDNARGVHSRSGTMLQVHLASSAELSADAAVIAAGAWSGILARQLGDRVLLESERGYNATILQPGIAVGRQLIFAERKFVATPLTCGLRIGGAAEFGGLEAAPNYRRSAALLTLARGYLPDLETDSATYWSGHRPATPDSLPVIGASRHHPRVIYAFGHGHLGLTQAATTGRLISELVCGQRPSIDLAPFSIGRFR
jgi:D-amino-acid dehydrogenase